MKIPVVVCLLVWVSMQLAAQLRRKPDENCTELFPRLFFANKTEISSNDEDLLQYLIRFNTQSECRSSYVIYLQNSRISKAKCLTQKMSVTQNTTFEHFIHTCQIAVLRNESNFTYSCYGGSVYDNKGYNSNKYHSNSQYTVSIPQKLKPIKLVSAADWGPIKKKTYTAIYPSLAEVMHDKDKYGQIHGLIIIGDIAYELYTNECQQFLTFMRELSTVSCVWPIIFIVGNHEASGLSSYIFLKNFNSVSIGESRTQVTELYNIKIIAFNPFLEIYNISSPQKYQKMKSLIINTIKEYKQSESHSFIILTSHYPITCSQEDFHCRQTLLTMSDLFEQISSMKAVDLYLGAHMHQYERIYPYVDKQFVNGSQSPYQRGMMVSIVEGVAGCDLGIIDTDFKALPNSAKHTFNKTGFGIIHFEGSEQNSTIVYEHLVTKPMLAVLDRIVIHQSATELKLSEE